MNSNDETRTATDFAERVRLNQQALRSNLKPLLSAARAPPGLWLRAE
jgi:hypothetical protein